jgi:hypothetical protein
MNRVKGMNTNQQEEGNSMKTLAYAVGILAFVGFSLLGCDDSSQTPVAPTDQTAQEAASLEKCIITHFAFTHSPIGLTGEGTVELVHGRRWQRDKWQIKKYGVVEEINLSLGYPAPDPPPNPDPLISGTMVHYLSATFDAITGEGPVHGSFTLTPLAEVGGGVWEGTYEGYRSKTSTPGVFTLPLKIVAHGKGGTLRGMQLKEESVLTAYGTPPTFWTGVGEGYYKSH